MTAALFFYVVDPEFGNILQAFAALDQAHADRYAQRYPDGYEITPDPPRERLKSYWLWNERPACDECGLAFTADEIVSADLIHGEDGEKFHAACCKECHPPMVLDFGGAA
jgi:hypothetical protein